MILYHRSKVDKFNELLDGLRKHFKFRVMDETTWFQEFNVTSWAKYPDVPLAADNLQSHEGKATLEDIQAYQQRVGSTGWDANVTRPDVALPTPSCHNS
ncbi:hypothetical protein LTR93_011186 [Exophiala xenobiotica]|nr:hypothetical protein LTR93_011186 [Exophiala xenobiotica]